MTLFVKDGRTFQQACKDNGLTFWQAYDKIRKYGYSPDKAIEHCKGLKEIYKCHGKTLRQYCGEHKIPYSSVISYYKLDDKESFETIVDKELYKKTLNSDTRFCKDKGIKYCNAKARHYYAITHKDCDKSFKDFCKDYYKL